MNNLPPIFLNTNLVKLRTGAGLTQEEIQTSLNVKRNTWSNWENKVSKPDVEDIVRISLFFGVSIDDLLLKDFGNANAVDRQTKDSKPPASLLDIHKRVAEVERRLAMLEKKV